VIRSSTISVFFTLLLLLVLLHGGRIQPIHSEKRMYKLYVEMTCIVLNLRTHSTCLFCWSDLECDIFSDVLLLYVQPKTKECCSMHTQHLLSSAVVLEFMRRVSDCETSKLLSTGSFCGSFLVFQMRVEPISMFPMQLDSRLQKLRMKVQDYVGMGMDIEEFMSLLSSLAAQHS
jgi:hypothetical protein